MIKRDDSLRALGLTYVATDKPTRAKLNAAAAAAGMPLSEYLRVLADKAISGKQGALPAITPGRSVDVSQRIAILSSQAIEMSKYIPMSKSRRMAVLSLANKHIKFNDLRHAQMLYDKMEQEFESVRSRVESLQRGQLTLNVGDMSLAPE